MKSLIPLHLLMLLFAIPAWSKAPGNNFASMTSLMTEVRDPHFKSAHRLKYLQATQNFMKQKLAKEINSDTKNITQRFIQDQGLTSKVETPAWTKIQSEFYTTLHQESFHQRWQKYSQSKNVSSFGKNIADSMQVHLGKYSMVDENLSMKRWQTITQKYNGKSVQSNIPFFVFGQDAKAMVLIDAHTPYEQLLEKPSQESEGNPSLSTFLKKVGQKSRDDYQDLAEKVKLNHRIYLRAVANGAKTIGSVLYLSGEFSQSETELRMGNYLYGFCDSCSEKDRADFKKAAMSYVLNKKKEIGKSYTVSTIVTGFCQSLKDNGYIFNLNSQKSPGYQAVDNTGIDKSKIQNGLGVSNANALNKTVLSQDLGILFVTSALSRLGSDGRVAGTNLSCHPGSLSSDVAIVRKAISEARQNVEAYIDRINSKIKYASYSDKEVTETLEYFTQTNVSATIEAVMNLPQVMDHVVETIVNVDKDVKRRKKLDKIAVWGGTIIGIGLAATGFGAPEGVALIASAVTIASISKGVAFGSYYLYRAYEEKRYFNELQKAQKALGPNFYLNQNLIKHYETYLDLRINYIAEFGDISGGFGEIYNASILKANGNIIMAHDYLVKAIKHAETVSQLTNRDYILERLSR